MEKKISKTKQKTNPLTLQRETLSRLEGSQLLRVIGGARIWTPLPGDTSPSYNDTGG
jgi:hypothetical protein